MVDATEPTWACRVCLTAFSGPAPRPCERLCRTCRAERSTEPFVAPAGVDATADETPTQP